MSPAIADQVARFNRMSLRERGLLAAAVLVAVVMGWVMLVLDPLSAKQKTLQGELSRLQQSIETTSQAMQSAAGDDATQLVRGRESELQRRLAAANAELASQSAGLIPPERMVQVIHDVLSTQRGVKLVSLQNKPVTTLLEPAPGTNATTDAAPALKAGPYVHRVELVIDGTYLDVLAYLRALEALPWRFYWRSLELQTTAYPVNRVRIELSTLSLDKEWIGV